MERQAGRSGAVCRSVARVLGASQSFGLRRQASWLKVWHGGRVDFDATERAHSGTEARLTRNVGGEVWSETLAQLIFVKCECLKKLKNPSLEAEF